MLTYLNKWCMQWCLDINVLKSNIIHFRPKKVPISQFVFKCDTQAIQTIDRYTYIGVSLDEHMTFSFVLTIVTHLVASHSPLALASIMFMEIVLMICIPNCMMPVLFQQCCMVLKYLNI